MKLEDIIYLDHASTTPVRQEVLNAMLPYFSERYGNPSSVHPVGEESHRALSVAYEQVAAVLNCQEAEVVFTSGGTEANNWALTGLAQALQGDGNHIVTTEIEHHAVLNVCHFLERQGFHVTYLHVDQYGLVDPDAVARSLTERTILVSVMYANNEVGTIEPVSEAAKAVKERARSLGRQIFVHTDAVQAAGFIDLDVQALGVDLMTLSAHKFQGPKGCGILYIRRGTPIEPLLYGGGQQQNRRSGTENVPGIVGTGVALKLAAEEREAVSAHCRNLRQRLVDRVFDQITGVKLNGHPSKRLPNNANLSFTGVDGEGLVIAMARRGIAASTGSACSAESPEPSHVLLALGLGDDLLWGSLRLTLGKDNSEEDVDRACDTIAALVNSQRGVVAPSSSPLPG